MKKLIAIGVVCLGIASFFALAMAFEFQVVGGAGPSTKVVKKFCAEFSEQPAGKNYRFRVPMKSIKHAGGIKSSDENIFGRTGRPLNEKEKAMNKAEIFLLWSRATCPHSLSAVIWNYKRCQI